MKQKLNFIIVFMLLFSACSSENPTPLVETSTEGLYFPPINSNTWEKTSLSNLGWDTNQLQPLLNYLEEKNTKSFIVLHEGKIVIEAYMNTHNETIPWYWASAGKTLTSAISGIAQKEGLININNKVSNYLGTGWSSAALEKENLITCKHLLSMTSGLDDSTGDRVDAENLKYIADAGTRWAYHNVYVKMQHVVSQASNQKWSDYFNLKLRDKIGMTGLWVQTGGLNVYWSNARSMARFGLMIYAKGTWENLQIIPQSFLSEATNTSQNMNDAYGYLWWLNGKTTYRLPSSQIKFQGKLVPNAPSDMYAALGKNDQKIYIVPSKKLVVIRMGESADTSNFALSNFDNDLWKKINLLIN